MNDIKKTKLPVNPFGHTTSASRASLKEDDLPPPIPNHKPKTIVKPKQYAEGLKPFPQVSRKELEKEVIRENTFGAKRWLLFSAFFALCAFVIMAYGFYLKDQLDNTKRLATKEITELKTKNQELKGKIDYINSSINELMTENKNHKKMIDEYQAQNLKTNEEKDLAIKNIEELSKKLEINNSKIAELELKLVKTKKRR